VTYIATCSKPIVHAVARLAPPLGLRCTRALPRCRDLQRSRESREPRAGDREYDVREASTLLGQVEILEGRDNVQAVNATLATEWVSLSNSNELDTRAVPFFSFGMPLSADESQRCGRFIYADLEVSNAVSTGMPVDSPGNPFPSHCTERDLSAQEKVAQFLFFELSSCL
jgi:hypothetical protein